MISSPGLKLLETAWKFYHQGKKAKRIIRRGGLPPEIFPFRPVYKIV